MKKLGYWYIIEDAGDANTFVSLIGAAQQLYKNEFPVTVFYEPEKKVACWMRKAELLSLVDELTALEAKK